MELNMKLIILTLRLIRRYKFLEQEMTNYSLQANSSPLLILANEALLEYSSFAIHFHITYDCFCNTIAELNSCNGDRMIYKAKTFAIWCLTKKFVNHCLIQSFGQSHYLHNYFFGGWGVSGRQSSNDLLPPKSLSFHDKEQQLLQNIHIPRSE